MSSPNKGEREIHTKQLKKKDIPRDVFLFQLCMILSQLLSMTFPVALGLFLYRLPERSTLLGSQFTIEHSGCWYFLFTFMCICFTYDNINKTDSRCLLFCNLRIYFPNLSRRVFIISCVIESRSYDGFQSHSLRAHESSILLGHESAIA